jgi:hypothetical protein
MGSPYLRRRRTGRRGTARPAHAHARPRGPGEQQRQPGPRGPRGERTRTRRCRRARRRRRAALRRGGRQRGGPARWGGWQRLWVGWWWVGPSCDGSGPGRWCGAWWRVEQWFGVDVAVGVARAADPEVEAGVAVRGGRRAERGARGDAVAGARGQRSQRQVRDAPGAAADRHRPSVGARPAGEGHTTRARGPHRRPGRSLEVHAPVVPGGERVPRVRVRPGDRARHRRGQRQGDGEREHDPDGTACVAAGGRLRANRRELVAESCARMWRWSGSTGSA